MSLRFHYFSLPSESGYKKIKVWGKYLPWAKEHKKSWHADLSSYYQRHLEPRFGKKSLDIEAIVQVCVDKAKDGDLMAVKLILDKVIPNARERRLSITLPRVALDQEGCIISLLSI